MTVEEREKPSSPSVMGWSSLHHWMMEGGRWEVEQERMKGE